ncbi:MAG TPA: glycoside hydrolase family 36 protein [Ktedonobacteraceae bacterium]|nr:glycoside hydrolase family 36 protein [Ktedonobacteraceae bacterium]
MDVTTLQTAQGFVRLADGGTDEAERIVLKKVWRGEVCHTTVMNQGQKAVRVQEIVLFSGYSALTPNTAFYGEGYQMLSQTAGTLEAPVDVGRYTDHKHYRMPQTPDMLTAYSMVTLSEDTESFFLMAFTSCRRFNGIMRLNTERFEIALDTEGLWLAPQEIWELEELFCAMGTDRNQLLSRLAEQIEGNHPRLPTAEIPSGWCSWYYYGPRISQQDIFDNLQAIAVKVPQLRYIQIDDGYQQAMGDWLLPGARFPGGMKELCQKIHEEGFEPAMWLAPFIAERGSRLALEHPEWLVKNDKGEPLLSSEVSFGGWRNGPWYMLDGTHPGTQEYFEQVFRVMREEWGCQYFKLDALTWGALHGGQHYDASATRIEAYRRGMQAVLRGAGENSFILGCNAPMWPSLGLVHGMRVSGDIARRWPVISTVARECFWRNWQHNRLWINDPDCVVLDNKGKRLIGPGGELIETDMTTVTADEFLFHATAIYASGGMILSGDNLASLPDDKIAMLHKLLPPGGIAAQFDDTTYQIGRIQLTDRQVLCLFNWSDEACSLDVWLDGQHRVRDYWSSEELGVHSGTVHITSLVPHSARLLVCY